jgi:hypothetical protein
MVDVYLLQSLLVLLVLSLPWQSVDMHRAVAQATKPFLYAYESDVEQHTEKEAPFLLLSSC